MNVCVAGLWHLGPVTAACLASAGHDIVAYDADPGTIENLSAGQPPVDEPGLAELVAAGKSAGRLRFTSDPADAVKESEILWIAYDTPVDDEDHADVAFVLDAVGTLLPHLRSGALVLVSSQLPVGTIRDLERSSRRDLHFAYSPENLRLGKAIDVFMHPDRVVVGVRTPEDQEKIAALLAPITTRIEWMSVESAEMTKHALNAFLAMSVAFINEVAAVCETVGADAREVERGLKTEKRIGPMAYLGPGGAFAGGTLARDVVFLSELGRKNGLPMDLINGVKSSNDAHRDWPKRRLTALLGGIAGKRIALWGLTYKPGTDTLRRSSAIELCRWLLAENAGVVAHDPAVKSLPPDLAGRVPLSGSALQAATDADAVVLSTEWPVYRGIDIDDLSRVMSGRYVLDANGFLRARFGDASTKLVHVTVGKAI